MEAKLDYQMITMINLQNKTKIIIFILLTNINMEMILVWLIESKEAVSNQDQFNLQQYLFLNYKLNLNLKLLV